MIIKPVLVHDQGGMFGLRLGGTTKVSRHCSMVVQNCEHQCENPESDVFLVYEVYKSVQIWPDLT